MWFVSLMGLSGGAVKATASSLKHVQTGKVWSEAVSGADTSKPVYLMVKNKCRKRY